MLVVTFPLFLLEVKECEGCLIERHLLVVRTIPTPSPVIITTIASHPREGPGYKVNKTTVLRQQQLQKVKDKV